MSFLNSQMVNKFYTAGGEISLRYTYPLDNESLVIDLGGYIGDFTQKIFDKYKCNIEVYEPVTNFYNKCVDRFKRYPDKITVFKYGVSNINESKEIILMNDGSSVYGDVTKNKEMIDIIDIGSIINNKQVDLLKINIEGPEFEIMERLIELGLIENVKNYQIQFHNFDYINDPVRRRDIIRDVLTKTHKVTYDFPFVWENWERIS